MVQYVQTADPVIASVEADRKYMAATEHCGTKSHFLIFFPVRVPNVPLRILRHATDGSTELISRPRELLLHGLHGVGFYLPAQVKTNIEAPKCEIMPAIWLVIELAGLMHQKLRSRWNNVLSRERKPLWQQKYDRYNWSSPPPSCYLAIR